MFYFFGCFSPMAKTNSMRENFVDFLHVEEETCLHWLM